MSDVIAAMPLKAGANSAALRACHAAQGIDRHVGACGGDEGRAHRRQVRFCVLVTCGGKDRRQEHRVQQMRRASSARSECAEEVMIQCGNAAAPMRRFFHAPFPADAAPPRRCAAASTGSSAISSGAMPYSMVRQLFSALFGIARPRTTTMTAARQACAPPPPSQPCGHRSSTPSDMSGVEVCAAVIG